jgi:hypothetical protein
MNALLLILVRYCMTRYDTTNDSLNSIPLLYHVNYCFYSSFYNVPIPILRPGPARQFHPIPVTVRLERILQLDVFVFCPCTVLIRPIARLFHLPRHSFPSTRSRRGNCIPDLATTVRLYCIRQLVPSSSAHLPVRSFARSMLVSERSCHLL